MAVITLVAIAAKCEKGRMVVRTLVAKCEKGRIVVRTSS